MGNALTAVRHPGQARYRRHEHSQYQLAPLAPLAWPGLRCVVPWTSFCEWEDTKPKKTKRWFAIDEERPLAFFAGIWTSWLGERGSIKNPRPGEHELFGFLASEPNAIVKPIHPKAMPVILTSEEEADLWLQAPWAEAQSLQRPLPEADLVLLPVSADPEVAVV